MRPTMTDLPGPEPSAREALQELPSRCARALLELRRVAPRVHCITNSAAAALTANVLLAVGAQPSLSSDEEEISDFVASADALLINLGTMDAPRKRAVQRALDAAASTCKPWVLDPVMVDRSAARLAQAQALLRQGPAVIRGNEAELRTLANHFGETDASGLARGSGATVVQTGRRDIVCGEAVTIVIENGHPTMSRITAMGCAGGALISAFLALGDGPCAAAWEAVLAFGVAGEIAGSESEGPGSLQVRLLDVLHGLDGAQIAARSRARYLEQSAANDLNGRGKL